VHVLQGERELASANKSLARFDLTGIPIAQRGVPQIEVTFDIDANGILHVSAKDKATGKEQSIQIKASSGLSDEEIQRMVKDAEANAAEDKRLHELVSARNQADNMIHTITKSLKDLGDKVNVADKEGIEKAIEDLKQVMHGDNKAEIEAKTNTLLELSGKIAQQAYGAAGVNPADMGGMGAGFTEAAEAAAAAAAYHQQSKPQDSNVVDAEFEEVKDKR